MNQKLKKNCLKFTRNTLFCVLVNFFLVSCASRIEDPHYNRDEIIKKIDTYKKVKNTDAKTKSKSKDEYAAIDDYLFNSYDTPKDMKKEKIQLGSEIGMEAAVGVQNH
ncbi:MAG: hypothetical protein GY756_20560 [bacterium]|nr:hypothetical protein [bacterium]